MSALRSKRGLRTEGNRNAEPHPSFAVLLRRTGVVGLAPQTTNDRRANTMKTYILRDPKTVEPQTAPLRARGRVVAQTGTKSKRPGDAEKTNRGTTSTGGFNSPRGKIHIPPQESPPARQACSNPPPFSPLFPTGQAGWKGRSRLRELRQAGGAMTSKV